LVELWVDYSDAWKVAQWAVEKGVMWVDHLVLMLAGLKAELMVAS
jgi:glutamine synthetase type III